MLLRDQTKRGGLGKTYKLLSEAGHEAASVTRPTVRARGMPRASESSIGESEVKHLKGIFATSKLVLTLLLTFLMSLIGY
jgi:hypothetical protein